MSSSAPSVVWLLYSIHRALQCAKTLEPWNILNVQLSPRRVWKQFSMRPFALSVSDTNLSSQNPPQLLVVNPPPPAKKNNKSRSCIIAWSCDDWTLNFIGNGSFFYHITPIYVLLKLVYDFCTYELNLVPCFLPGWQISSLHVCFRLSGNQTSGGSLIKSNCCISVDFSDRMLCVCRKMTCWRKYGIKSHAIEYLVHIDTTFVYPK